MNKVAIVTGASTGIGRSISIYLAKMGYTVYLLGRNLVKLNETKELIDNFSGKSVIKQIDLSSVIEINEFITYLKNIENKVLVLVNCAAIWHSNTEVYANKSYESFNQNVVIDTMNVGILAPMLLAHGLVGLMEKGSSIINISGTFENGAKGWLPYYVSKKAIEELTIGLSQELEEQGIQVNCISPSDTATQAYAKFFPEYISESISPDSIAKEVFDLINSNNTGLIKIVKKTS